MRHCIVSVNCTVYSLFQFNLSAFYNQNNITTKLRLKLKSFFKVSQTNRQIDIPLCTDMGHKK